VSRAGLCRGFEVLRLDGPDDDVGHLERGSRRRPRGDAELADQAAPGPFARIDDDDRGGGAAGLEQPADEGLGHVAAADEDDVAHGRQCTHRRVAGIE
jgi:hypothetical protein